MILSIKEIYYLSEIIVHHNFAENRSYQNKIGRIKLD